MPSISGLGARIGGYVRMARELNRDGVRLGSAMLVPMRRRIGALDDQLTLQSGLRISAPKDVPLVALFRDIWVSRCYAPADPMLRRPPDIIDIGANVGVFSLWAACTYPEARIVAVEPSNRMCKYLRGNVAANGLSRIHVVHAACHAVCGEATLYTPGDEVMNSLYALDSQGSVFRPLQQTKVTSLAALFAQHDVRDGAFLKLDCEGAEYEILYAAPADVLRRIACISMEYHLGFNEHQPEELARHLRQHGFHVSIGAPVCPDAGYLHARRASPGLRNA
jgi:FkbM family methyltransferase